MPAVAAGSAGASGAPAPRVSAFWSRILVAAVALPIVLGLVWLGGWWLLALAAVAGAIALHEYFAMIRELRPPALAGFVGLGLGLLGERLGGLEWMLGGVLVSLPLAFVLHAVARTRGGATVAIASTFLGAAWIGLGLGPLLLLRDLPDNGRLAAFTVILTVFAADTAAYFLGRPPGRRKLVPSLSPGKTWEGFVAGVAVALFVTFISLYRTGFVDGWRSLVLGGAIALTAGGGGPF